MEELIIKVDGKEYRVHVEETEEGKIKVYCEGDVYEVETKGDAEHCISENKKAGEAISKGKTSVAAPLPGIITEVKIKEGDLVKQGDVIIRLIAMKMENDITATKNGIVRQLSVKKDAKVNKGDLLAIIE